MHKLLSVFLLAGVVFGQSSVSTDLTAVQAALTKAIGDANAPPPAPDPVLVLVKATPAIYMDLQNCVGNASGCKLLAVVYECPRPAPWGSATAYLFGDFVADSANNVYRLTLITPPATGPTVSGTSVPWVTTALGSTTVDGPYTWTLVALPTMAWTCVASSLTAQ